MTLLERTSHALRVELAGDEMKFVFECAALQMLRDMSTQYQGVHSMRCFVSQDNMVLTPRSVHDAMKMVGAARLR